MAVKSYIKKANSVVPSKAQLEFMDTEFIAFIHYGMNTFTNTEWGSGREPEKYFKPADLIPLTHCFAEKSAGLKYFSGSRPEPHSVLVNVFIP